MYPEVIPEIFEWKHLDRVSRVDSRNIWRETWGLACETAEQCYMRLKWGENCHEEREEQTGHYSMDPYRDSWDRKCKWYILFVPLMVTISGNYIYARYIYCRNCIVFDETESMYQGMVDYNLNTCCEASMFLNY